MLTKICSRCGRVEIDYNAKYCNKCSSVKDRERKESYKEYKNRRMKDAEERKRQRFYNSTAWISCRDNIKKHQLGMDLIEWSNGKIVDADTYHHVVELKENYDKRLDKDNVIGLTQSNHLKVHSLMDKSERDKRKIQEFLKELLKQFEKEYY
ncbi:hypothetical protein G8S55_11650 [Clostridium botulinum C]|uniref:hypothetical protein n=1 Tax=Clostridium botulinum TaxID=1491 RepID=UPI001E3E7453|nr:hypothetical protein [Clostridium botulinum]MCD3217872.1 hypothetical protein [Clostridium botulinum C]